jgi:hypothetical protein
VVCLADDPNSWIRELGDHVVRAVVASVVDDYELEVVECLIENAADRLRRERPVAIDAHDDRDRRHTAVE